MRPLVHLIVIAVAAAGLLATGCGASGDESAGADRDRPLVLATTTSTQDSGLLEELVPAFERETGWRVKAVAVGSGQAIALGERGEADVVLVHSPDAERELMDTGKAGERRIVMHNDFVVVGPASDPAGVEGATAAGALERIARHRAPFASRGDDSGTHAFELDLWARAGIEPQGDWYEETGQGMGVTLRVASERRGYTVSDRGTLLTTNDGNDLEVLVEGEPELLNVYHVIDMTSTAGPRVNAAGGRAFADWIVSPQTQEMIGAFGRERFGQPLFTPDAGKDEGELSATRAGRPVPAALATGGKLRVGGPAPTRAGPPLPPG